MDNRASRADVPWDRPAPEAWPPSEDAATDYPPTWSAQGGAPASPAPASDAPEPDRFAANPLTADAQADASPPWDRPARDQLLDPDDAMAPLVSDISRPLAPQPMTVTAHSDQPHGGDEPRPPAWGGRSGNAQPEWPAEDDLTPASSGRGPVMPHDSRPVAAHEPARPSEPEQPEPEPEPEPGPMPTREEDPQFPVAPPARPQPAPASPGTPVFASAQIVPLPAGSPQNMVLRIELTIVDDSQRAVAADEARRVGPDANVRGPEYNPRLNADRADAPEPEYIWRAPAQPTQPDWDRPQVDSPQVGVPQPDQPAPWLAPDHQRQRQQPQQPPVAPPPTWALTQPAPPDAPQPPQYRPPTPYPQQPQQAAWPASQSRDPLRGLPAAANVQSASAGNAASGADLWSLGNQPTATATDEEVEPQSKSSTALTAVLTVGFALLVILLAFVFVQLMTSLLR